MSFKQPFGRIIVNTKQGIYRRINPLNRDNYILLGQQPTIKVVGLFA